MTTVLEATETKLQLQRTFKAPINRVWAAWTDPDQVYRWFGCSHARGLSAEIDLRVGGVYNVVMGDGGEGTLTMRGKIAELAIPHRIKIDWKWDGGPMSEIPTTHVTIALSEVKGGTQVTLTHTGFPNAEICNEHQNGWSAGLEKISEFVNSAEAEVFEVMAEWTDALVRKDAEGLVQDYVADSLLYDVGCQQQGPEQIKALWEQCLPFFGDKVGLLRKDLKLTVSGDMAFMTCLSCLTGMTGDCSDSEMARSWIRVTVCYQKIDGRWKVLHEHISIPVDCMNNKPAYILD